MTIIFKNFLFMTVELNVCKNGHCIDFVTSLLIKSYLLYSINWTLSFTSAKTGSTFEENLNLVILYNPVSYKYCHF